MVLQILFLHAKFNEISLISSLFWLKYFLRLGDLKLVKVNTLDDYRTISSIVFIYQAGFMSVLQYELNNLSVLSFINRVSFIYVFNLEECYFTQIISSLTQFMH